MFRLLSPLSGAVAAAAALSASSVFAQDAIRIGEYASLTGKEAAFGQSSHKGTLLAVEGVNAAGGVLGRKLELITEDNQSKQGESATIVKKLISRDKVVAILGEVASMRSLEAAPICQAYRVPMVSPSSTNPKVTEIGSYIFRVCFTDRFQGQVLAKFAKDTLKIRRVAVLTSVSSAYSVGLARYFDERFAADGGVVAVEQKYTEGDKDFNAQLTAIKAAGVEGVFVPGYYTEAALVCKQARELGITVPLFGGDGWEAPELVEIGGQAVEGCYYTTHYSAQVDAPAVRAFVARFQARFGGETPDAMAALGFDSVEILADAIRRAGSVEGPAVRDALAATTDFEGVTGKTTMDKERNASKAAFVIMVRDGRFAFVQSIAP
ncbi:MAG: ABC transporter substrate-binding protein [Opitutaceae bacterium]|jgi:branched-chain amino acid transport system substrate-binding protein